MGLSLMESTDLLGVSEDGVVGILRYFSRILLIEEWSFGDMFSLRTLFVLLLSTGSDLRAAGLSVEAGFVGVLEDCRFKLSPAFGSDDLAAFNVSTIFSETLSAISSNPIDFRLEALSSTGSDDRFLGTVTLGAEARRDLSND